LRENKEFCLRLIRANWLTCPKLDVALMKDKSFVRAILFSLHSKYFCGTLVKIIFSYRVYQRVFDYKVISKHDTKEFIYQIKLLMEYFFANEIRESSF
jgi:hypothetical protein